MPLKEIVGQKVTLKPLCKEYFADYHHMFSPTVRKILGLPEMATLQDTQNFLKAKVTEIKRGKTFFYCIFDNADKTLIGAIEIREPGYHEGQLGAWINENYWGQGCYQEALGLILKSYFEATDEASVNAHVKVENARSLKAHQKYGFEVIREFDKNRQKHYEMVIYRGKVV
ncbi:GNAT family N-acetyltransferase [Candidatus Dependentiae bacterium]